jgi:predicted nucleic acid-binding protein
MVVHPRKHPDIKIWVQHALHASYSIVVPEIADYEVRRELLRINAVASLRRLDDLKSATLYLPLSTSTMLRAASLWAQLRNAGIPTAVDTALDGDVLLAAQAMLLAENGYTTVIATTNVKHINRLVPAQLWHEIIF